MLRIVLVVLGLLFLAGIPRYVKSPWFDDRFTTDNQGPGGRSIRVEVKDSALFTIGPQGRNAVLTVISQDSGPRISLTCVIRSVSINAAGGDIETVPSSYCRHSSIPVQFDGFDKLTVRVGGQGITASREYRRNPIHTLIEWIKWRANPQGVALFNVREA